MSRSVRPRPSAGGVLFVAPVASVWLDGVGRDDFTGVEVDDADAGFVEERDDAFAAVFGADPEVVHPSGSAQADFAAVADAVVSDSEVAGSGAGGERFRARSIGVARGPFVVGAVRAVLVVVVAEAVKLRLQLDDCGRGGLRGEESFQGLVEAFDFALGLRVSW